MRFKSAAEFLDTKKDFPNSQWPQEQLEVQLVGNCWPDWTMWDITIFGLGITLGWHAWPFIKAAWGIS